MGPERDVSPLERALREDDSAYFERSAGRENTRRISKAPLLAHAGLVPLVSPEQRRSDLEVFSDGLKRWRVERSERQQAEMWGAICGLTRLAELRADMTLIERRITIYPEDYRPMMIREWLARAEQGQPAIPPEQIPRSPHPCFGWLLRIDQHLPPEGRAAFERGDMKTLSRFRDEVWKAHKESGCDGRCQGEP